MAYPETKKMLFGTSAEAFEATATDPAPTTVRCQEGHAPAPSTAPSNGRTSPRDVVRLSPDRVPRADVTTRRSGSVHRKRKTGSTPCGAGPSEAPGHQRRRRDQGIRRRCRA
jgi:hypothetical protein